MNKIVSIVLDEVAQTKFNTLKKRYRYKDYADFLVKMIDEQYQKIK
jgi:hypothetical protein